MTWLLEATRHLLVWSNGEDSIRLFCHELLGLWEDGKHWIETRVSRDVSHRTSTAKAYPGRHDCADVAQDAEQFQEQG